MNDCDPQGEVTFRNPLYEKEHWFLISKENIHSQYIMEYNCSSRIVHSCPVLKDKTINPSGPKTYIFEGRWCMRPDINIWCSWCHSSPGAELQGLFILHNWENLPE